LKVEFSGYAFAADSMSLSSFKMSIHLWFGQKYTALSFCAACLQACGRSRTFTACRKKAMNGSGTRSGNATWTAAVNRPRNTNWWKL